MKYTALAIVFVLTCVVMGLWFQPGRRQVQPWLAAVLASGMVAAQYALLTLR
jgi:hypothetical protein